ncbi:hypothetical protein [Shinella sp. JR1-6]|uniref:hypothetical protein n=1 Tax=Shinella sp. JR1-6 TaxID=2527671 RepID=UPI00102D4AE8|nr:hypothetical protein [Shinella sp. JR1-6]TAA51052.1 hypothetical protein EXZ48_32015 [Shinella sp. JR1-6]
MIKFIDSLIAWLTNPGAKAAELAAAIRSAGSLWSSTETQSKLDEKITSIQAGENVTINWLDPLSPIINAQGTGFGDMAASMYDPTSVQADAFDRANHHGNIPAGNVTGLATVATSGSYNDLSDTPPAGGTVSSVALTVPTGLSVAGSPITTTGTFAVTYAAGYQGYTSAEATKLSGIEASADVTDAGNVGSSIHGATEKTTPVDADEIGLIDSAASNVLKRVTWANVKATLKAYFDTLYGALATANLWTKPQRGSSTTLTSGTTITQDLADGNNWDLTLGHNATLANPTNQSSYVKLTGGIDCVQDGTGGRTLAFGSNWYPIGAATAPAAPTGANAKFRIDFKVVSSTRIDFSLRGVGV